MTEQLTAPTLVHVTSADGTDIAIDRTGDGPPVVLVCGGSVDRWSNQGLALALAPSFSVYNFDRRGRGDSGDTLPYAVEREVEDIDAVIRAAGGSAHLFGSSSGAGLALEAATRLPGVARLALWEPPYMPDPTASMQQQVALYDRLLAEGKRGEMVEYFMADVVGMPPEFVEFARTQPFWAATEKLAHTLAYDATVMGDYTLPLERAATIAIPTIVLAGGASFPWMQTTAKAIADVLPKGEYRLLDGQEHNVAPDVLGPVLAEFFGR